MARKPNYDFERKERERLKAQKKAEKSKPVASEAVTDADTTPTGETDPN